MVSGRNVYEISMGFKKKMSDCGSYDISQGFFIFSNGVECLCDVYGVSMGVLWDLYGISLGCLKDFFANSMGFL